MIMRITLMILAVVISQISFAGPTHMGVEPGELVSLILVCQTQNGGKEFCGFKRTSMASGTEADFFKIPDGQVLIVTEFDWKYVNTDAFDLENQLIEVHLRRAALCLSDPQKCPLPPVKSFGKAEHFGPSFTNWIFASGHVQMTTGFAISSFPTLDVAVQDTLGKPLPFEGDSAELHVTVRGYLVPTTCGIPGAPPCR